MWRRWRWVSCSDNLLKTSIVDGAALVALFLLYSSHTVMAEIQPTEIRTSLISVHNSIISSIISSSRVT